jgi:hypothetical protein
MLRSIISAALVCLSTTAFAQVFQQVEPITFGGGCEKVATSYGPKLGTCMLSDNRARVWCPNGKVFERSGSEVQPALVRSICGLNQVL